MTDYKRISDFAEETQPGSIYLHGKTGSNNRKIVSCYDWNNRCRNRIKRITDDFDRISMARKTFKYRNALSFFVYFTMLFNGGLVPQYIMWTTFFHIKDTYAALIFPNLLMTAFNIFLVRNYYSNSLPEALYEAAQLDGASELGIFTKIVFPLSKPVVATIGLFTGLSYWNSWTNALYYVQDQNILVFRIC